MSFLVIFCQDNIILVISACFESDSGWKVRLKVSFKLCNYETKYESTRLTAIGLVRLVIASASKYVLTALESRTFAHHFDL